MPPGCDLVFFAEQVQCLCWHGNPGSDVDTPTRNVLILRWIPGFTLELPASDSARPVKPALP